MLLVQNGYMDTDRSPLLRLRIQIPYAQLTTVALLLLLLRRTLIMTTLILTGIEVSVDKNDVTRKSLKMRQCLTRVEMPGKLTDREYQGRCSHSQHVVPLPNCMEYPSVSSTCMISELEQVRELVAGLTTRFYVGFLG